jgi:transposase of ISThsp20, IS5 family IS427 group , ORFA
MLILSKKKDMKWLMMDATHIKVHPHEAKAKGGNEGMSRTKRGLKISSCTWR